MGKVTKVVEGILIQYQVEKVVSVLLRGNLKVYGVFALGLWVYMEDLLS